MLAIIHVNASSPISYDPIVSGDDGVFDPAMGKSSTLAVASPNNMTASIGASSSMPHHPQYRQHHIPLHPQYGDEMTAASSSSAFAGNNAGGGEYVYADGEGGGGGASSLSSSPPLSAMRICLWFICVAGITLNFVVFRRNNRYAK